MNFLIKRTISEFPIAMDWPGSYSSDCFLPFKSVSVSIIAIDAVLKKLNIIYSKKLIIKKGILRKKSN
jgi:hypothetical protein